MPSLNTPKPWKPVEIPYSEPGTSEEMYGSCLENRPEQMRLVGLIVGTWSHIEWQLVELFAYIGNTTTWRAAYEMQTIRNLQPRIATILSSLEQAFGEQAVTTARPILRRASRIKKDRDAVAHCSFILRSSRPNGIIALRGWGSERKYFVYELNTLEALLTQIYEVESSIRSLRSDIMAHFNPEVYEKGRWVTISALTSGPMSEISID